jgi:hypothetical protein
MFQSLTSQLGALAMVLVCGFAMMRGRWPERVSASTLAVNWVGCEAFEDWSKAATVQPTIFGIDVAYDLLLLALALTTQRIWIVCAFTFQSLIVLIHILSVFDPILDRLEFFQAYYILSYGVLVALAFGTAVEGRSPPRFPSRRTSATG